jgi:hypothetical protein
MAMAISSRLPRCSPRRHFILCISQGEVVGVSKQITTDNNRHTT